MKHYIIWNLSAEWDDIYGEAGPTIEYISYDLKDAEAYFDKMFGDTPSLPNNKWRYEYMLEEIEDGYKRLDFDDSKVKEIKRIANYEILSK